MGDAVGFEALRVEVFNRIILLPFADKPMGIPRQMAGIYFFRKMGREAFMGHKDPAQIVYIGVSKNIRWRIKKHKVAKRFYDGSGDWRIYFKKKDDFWGSREQEEAFYITIMNPLYNKGLSLRLPPTPNQEDR